MGATRAKAHAVRASLRSYILGTYGAHAVQVLEGFGMTVPKQPGPKTVATKATAVARNKATRVARHTMGKKQKLRIKGDPEVKPAPPTGG